MNEFEFIRQLRELTSARKTSPRVVAGIGDDAAVIRQASDRDLLISTDLLIEGVDFYREATPPPLLGHKALAVSLSDIAAMGARPMWALVSIGLPSEVWSSEFKEKFFEGYLALADRYGVALAGGDVSESKQIVVDSIVVGEVSTGHAIRRSTAKIGDQIFVTGTLGAAAAGLKLIELGARLRTEPRVWSQESEPRAVATGSSNNSSAKTEQHAEDQAINSLLLRQLAPQPRVGWGIVLGEEKLATSMIDISDGLSSDLHHLCEDSSVDATIESAQLPLDEDVKHLCGRRALDPLALALHGGEDFELLFTVSRENISRLPKRVDGITVSRIGEVTHRGQGIVIREKSRSWNLQPQGFAHFTRRSP